MQNLDYFYCAFYYNCNQLFSAAYDLVVSGDAGGMTCVHKILEKKGITEILLLYKGSFSRISSSFS